jgi:hypothetical protein
MGGARILTFGDTTPAEGQAEAAATQLEWLLTAVPGMRPAAAFSGHTARDMTRKLAAVFDRVVDAAK